MSIDWRVYGASTVVSSLHKSELSGFFRNIVVGPNEAAVIIRDGKIERTITGTRRNTSGLWDNFKKLWGRSSQLEVVFVDTSPIDLAFYIGKSARQESGIETGQISASREDAYKTIEDRSRERIDSTDLTISALTSDGQYVSAEVNVTLRVLTSDAQLLTTLLRGKPSVADWDISTLVKDELLAKALVPIIGQHPGKDIRGNQELLARISQNAESILRTKFDLYGLELLNMYINWGLTDEDELVIAEGRKDREDRAVEFEHQRKVREQERELQLDRQRVSNLIELRTVEAEGDVDIAEIVLSGELNRENLVDGKRINQEKVSAEIKDIQLAIIQKENQLRIDTEKSEADVRFAIEQRQVMFDQEITQREEERRQQTLDTESQRELAEMRELNKMQIERQEVKKITEQETATQRDKAEYEKLKARLDSSQSRTQEEQRTLRELMSKAGSADPEVLKEMLKQGTDREFTEATDAKMESRSKSQQADAQADTAENSVTQPDATDETGAELEGPTCRSCSSPVQAGWKACPFCGTPVERRCRGCSALLEEQWNNCPLCGFSNA